MLLLVVGLSELGARGFLLLLLRARPTVRSSRAMFSASISFAAPRCPPFRPSCHKGRVWGVMGVGAAGWARGG